jgi:hypothetical protein
MEFFFLTQYFNLDLLNLARWLVYLNIAAPKTGVLQRGPNTQNCDISLKKDLRVHYILALLENIFLNKTKYAVFS